MAKKILNRYVAVAIGAEHYPAEDGKSPRIGVECRVVEGEDAGKTFYWYGSLAEGEAQRITIESLRLMGWQDNDIMELTGLGSTRFVATEYEEVFNGKTQKRYGIWEMKAKREVVRTEDRKAFAAQFKAAAAQIAPVKITELNKAPDVIPQYKATEDSNGAAKRPDGLPF